MGQENSENTRKLLLAFRESSGDSSVLINSLRKQQLLGELPTLLQDESVMDALVRAYDKVHGTTAAQESDRFKHLKPAAFVVAIFLEAVKMEFIGSKEEENRIIDGLQSIIERIQEEE